MSSSSGCPQPPLEMWNPSRLWLDAILLGVAATGIVAVSLFLAYAADTQDVLAKEDPVDEILSLGVGTIAFGTFFIVICAGAGIVGGIDMTKILCFSPSSSSSKP